jgi:hypothetical protein
VRRRGIARARVRQWRRYAAVDVAAEMARASDRPRCLVIRVRAHAPPPPPPPPPADARVRPAGANAAAEVATLRATWAEAVDEESGYPYYVNVFTGESRVCGAAARAREADAMLGWAHFGLIAAALPRTRV